MNPIFGLVYFLFYLIYCYVEAFVKLFIPRTSQNVAGKVVLVTGAGHGIGRELALQFGRRGARLVLWDVNKRNNESVASEVEEGGGFAKAYTVDVTDPTNIATVSRQVRRDVGHVDILINNAGILNGGSVLKLREDDIRRLFNVNVLAHFWTVREFLPAMQERGEGHIVGIASIAARTGTAYLTDYSASKFAVTGFMESLQDEMRREGHTGLNFTTVFPFFVDTGMAKNITSKFTPAMPIDWVASVIVEGVCQNKRDVYIPGSMERSVRMSGLFPKKFVDKLMQALEIGINPQYE